MTVSEELVASIKWSKDSKKVGKLLERIADVVEAEAHRRSEEFLDVVWQQGYDHALEQVQKFGLPALLKPGVGVEDE
jgi:hypothetical protein